MYSRYISYPLRLCDSNSDSDGDGNGVGVCDIIGVRGSRVLEAEREAL